MPKSFTDSKTAIHYLANRYGSTNYDDWQSLRKEFWSYQAYGASGSSTFTFFGEATGQNGTTKQLTNMPKSGSFGQVHFLVKEIRTKLYVENPSLDTWAGEDADTIYSDLVLGFMQAGVLEFTIQNRVFAQIPRPFLYAPPADGREEHYTAGIDDLSLAEGTPNTLSTYVTHPPFATQNCRGAKYIIDPNILIEAEQNFDAKINFPSGAVSLIATDVHNASSNPFYIGVEFSGLVLRPMQ